MGNLVTAESLALRWAELCSDASLENLPYKIELNSWGKIEMSPASFRHALLQGTMAAELGHQLASGRVLVGCPVLTEIGVRVPDVAWASEEFDCANRETTPCQSAPEICVEILAPDDTDAEISAKTKAYLAAGAHEVWAVEESGAVHYFDSAGEMTTSRFGVAVSLPPRPAP